MRTQSYLRKSVFVFGFAALFAFAPLALAAQTWFGADTSAMGSSYENKTSTVAWSPQLGLFVSVASSIDGNNIHNTAVMTSTDGITWVNRATPNWTAGNNWSSIVWAATAPNGSGGSGLFVAVSGTGTYYRVMTSPDGITWTGRTAAEANAWSDITWSPSLNLFVAVATGGTHRVMTSPDGITWTGQTAGAAMLWDGVAWSPTLNLFVAVAATGANGVMTSPDGVTWTQRTASNNNWRKVMWSSVDSLFVAVSGAGTSSDVMTSPDGITWTNRTTPVWGFFNITYSPTLDLYVATGWASTGTANNVMTSPDAITWTSRLSTDVAKNWTGVTWSPSLGLFVSVAGSGTNRVMTSTDGITWTARSTSYILQNMWEAVAWSPQLGLFAAVAYDNLNGNSVMTSPDGKNWTLRTTPTDGSYYWISIVWAATAPNGSGGSGLFVAVSMADTGGNKRVMTSPDGITWTSHTASVANTWTSVTWSPSLNLFVAVAMSGTLNQVMTSPDGVTWTTRTTPENNYWNQVIWVDALNLFVAVAYGGSDTPTPGSGHQVMTSPDGITWTVRNGVSDTGWAGVAWSPTLNLLVAVGWPGSSPTNEVMTSPDGITWTGRTAAEDNLWTSVIWSPELGKFVAVALDEIGYTSSAHHVMTSTDGINWTIDTSSVVGGAGLANLAWSPDLGVFVVVAESGSGAGRGNGGSSAFYYGPYLPYSVSATPATTSATITWTTDEASDSLVNYGLTSSYGSSTTLDAAAVTSHSVSVTGLTCATTYHYRAVSAHGGVTSTSSDATFTTSSCASAPTVSSAAASSITTTTATLGGSISATGGATITARGFNYGTTSGYGTVVTENGSFSTGSFTAAVTGLLCGTTYHYQAYATNTAGTGTSSPDATFATSTCPVIVVPAGGGGGGGLIIAHSAPQAAIPAAPSIIEKPKTSASYFVRNLKLGSSGADVKALQQFLNKNGFFIAKNGAGSPGKETELFAAKTAAALKRFQEAHKKEILTPLGLKKGTGMFGTATMVYVNGAIDKDD